MTLLFKKCFIIFSAASAQIESDTNDDQQQATDCKLDESQSTPFCNVQSNVTHLSLHDSIGSPL